MSTVRVADKKTIIIDFGEISTPYCGLAEVSLNFACALENQNHDGLEFRYIVPQSLLANAFLDKSKSFSCWWWRNGKVVLTHI